MNRPRLLRRRGDNTADQSWGDNDDSVAGLLEQYGRTLSPDAATLSRVGASVRAAFVEAGIGQTDEAADRLGEGPVPGVWAGRGRVWSWSRRRAFASLCAATILCLSTVGFAAAQSGPGQPFYRLRLGIEGVNLPLVAQGDPTVEALNRADARLADIATETAASDWGGAADAAGAYSEVIDTIVLPAASPARVTAGQRLEGQLSRLEQLRGKSRGIETPALDKAIAAVSAILGVPIPTPTPTPPTATSRPASGSSRDPDSSQTATDSGDHDGNGPNRSGGSSGNGGPGESDGNGGHQGSGGSGGDHASPTPGATPTDGHGGGSGQRH